MYLRSLLLRRINDKSGAARIFLHVFIRQLLFYFFVYLWARNCPAPTLVSCPELLPRHPDLSFSAPDFPISAPRFLYPAPISAPIRDSCPDEISSKPATFCRLAFMDRFPISVQFRALFRGVRPFQGPVVVVRAIGKKVTDDVTVVVTVAAIGKRVDTASTNHRSLRLFTAPSAVSCQ